MSKREGRAKTEKKSASAALESLAKARNEKVKRSEQYSVNGASNEMTFIGSR